MRDLPSLTGLRGVAAIWVMMFHISQWAPALGAPWLARVGLSPAGWVGVDLFFVLSGFILMWVHGAEFARPTAVAAGRFALRRLARVYPTSLAALGLIALLVLADPTFAAWYRAQDPDNLSAAAFVRTALLATRWTNGGGDWNEPVWSLSAELVGYAAFPLLAWLMIGRAPRVSLAVAVLCLVALAAFQVLTGLAGSNAYGQTAALTRMGCCFTAGVAVCRLRQALGERPAKLAPIGVLAGCFVVVVGCHFKLGTLAAPAGFALVVFFLSFGTGVLNRLLSSSPAMALGRISYPLYLIHLTPLLWMVAHTRPGGLGPVWAATALGAYVVLSLGAATLLHRWIERPSHRWARRDFVTGPALAAGAPSV